MFRNSEKIFIYNGAGSCKESVDDLATLLSSHTIFGVRPDVVRSTFTFNFDGLENPTFVVPGGSTFAIGLQIVTPLRNIREHFGSQFNYVGICAGAFIGTETADMALDPDEWHSKREFGLPGLFPESTTLGPFSPRYREPANQKFTPYRVTLSLADRDTMSGLYVDGPAIVPVSRSGQPFDVLATYADKPEYEFAGNKVLASADLGAIVRRQTHATRGGVFLSGVHVESYVRDSAFLRLFSTPNQKSPYLSTQDHQQLERDREENERKVTGMLRETFSK